MNGDRIADPKRPSLRIGRIPELHEKEPGKKVLFFPFLFLFLVLTYFLVEWVKTPRKWLDFQEALSSL